jgi:hypothetical protein
MTVMTRTTICTAVVLGALLALAPRAPAQEASEGEKVGDFTFRDLRNHDGRTALRDFRGQPVFIEFWGTR